MSNPNKGKWYRFNDTVVEEFEMTEESLESECFGGKYKAKFSDTCKFVLCMTYLPLWERSISGCLVLSEISNLAHLPRGDVSIILYAAHTMAVLRRHLYDATGLQTSITLCSVYWNL